MRFFLFLKERKKENKVEWSGGELDLREVGGGGLT